MAEVKLTRDQQAAVESRGSRLLISAAAGSGKTKVLVDRLLSYLCDEKDPANVDEFLIITFTKAAAAELRSKISGALSERLARDPGNRHLQKQLPRIYLAKISTVDSFCGDVLREYAYRLDIPADFRVADGPECQELRQRAMDRVLEEAYGRLDEEPEIQQFLDTLGAGRNDGRVPEILAQVYDKIQCHPDPGAFLERCRRDCDLDGVEDPGKTIWGAYLMEDLHEFLEESIGRVEELADLAEKDESLAPKAAPMLRDMAWKLRELSECKTWTAVHEKGVPTFLPMPALRKPTDPDLRDRVRETKNQCAEELKEKLRPFGDGAKEVMEDLGRTGGASLGIFRLVEDFTKAFRQEKDRRRVLDFGDLEHLTLGLLVGRSGSPTAVARELGSRFREVMVDEYQDSNAVQDAIYGALTGEKKNCFMVGDVKQSIYRFRMADPSIFLKKYETYAPLDRAEPGQDRKILLSENFRSGGAVLSAVNDVFSCVMCPEVGGLYYGSGEALKEGVPHVPLGQPETELHCITYPRGRDAEGFGKYEYEADFAAERIRELLNGDSFVRDGAALRRIQPKDIVILLRSPGTSGRYYAQALQKRGIPCATGAREDILESAEIGVLLSLLRIIDNPRQDIPLTAALLSPLFGMTADRLAELRARHKKDAVYDCLLAAKDRGEADAAAFLETLNGLRQAARQMTLAELVEEIFHRTRLDAVFAAMDQGERRLWNLRYFYQTAANYEQSGRKELSQFLAYLDSLGDRGLTPEEGDNSRQAVTIMSIHKSKGLEFPVVILGNLSAAFNREDLNAPVLTDPELGVGCHVVDPQRRIRYPSVAWRAIALRTRQENLSEELRLLYVAMTRARDRLILLYTSSSLAGHLTELARDAELPRCPYLSRRVSCMGDWVLIRALTRTEAGALHAISQRPETVEVSEIPWRIEVHPGQVHETEAQTGNAPEEQEVLPPDLKERLAYRYPHEAATQAASKLTATQMKGRAMDQEAAEDSPVQRKRSAPSYPDFREKGPLTGKEAGTATHLAMQFLRYEPCGTEEGIRRELQRLVKEEYLTARQAEAVSVDQILTFFGTELGKRLRRGDGVLREFKFSILTEAGELDPALRGERFLLQGVVDCCLMEEDGMTVLDFKTDRVEPGRAAARAEAYGPQVRTYGKALARIFHKPVKRLCLYFFRTGALIEVPKEP